MKTLANCSPREFLKQTNRIRISAEKWLTATKVLEIRQRMPKIDEPIKPSSQEELREQLADTKQKYAEQMRQNMFAMLEAMLDTNADETLELMALVCFIEPKDIDKYTMSQMFIYLSDVMEDEGVVAFFGSLVRLGATRTVQGA